MSIFAPEKRSWLISLVLSVIYFLNFLAAASGTFDAGLLFGFCVWGAPDLPDEENGCRSSPVNSHIIAFVVDVIMTLIVGYLYTKDKAEKKQTLTYIAFGGIILAHGALHYFISSPAIDCWSEIDKQMEETGYNLFAIFTFFLSLIILGAGFGLAKLVPILGGSAVFTAVVVYVTKNIGNGEYVLPGLFCVVHPLSSFTGLLAKDMPSFSSTVGWWFVVATTVGILELSTCLTFFRSIGGHFFYDLTLHTAIIFALPYFVNKESSGVKKD